MSEQQKGNMPASEQSEPVIFGMARSIVKGTARVGLNATSVPLSVLPGETRTRARRAIAELAMVPISISTGVAGFADRFVESVYKMEPMEVRGEPIADRVRTFTDRLSRAAQEFTGTLTSSLQTGTTKVDEWVEKPKAGSK